MLPPMIIVMVPGLSGRCGKCDASRDNDKHQ
jgi:hypothetical protein